VAVLALAVVAAAQSVEGVPVEHVVRIPPGGWVDLDSGAVLPAPEQRPLRADLRFDRDGQGFFLAPLFGGMAAAAQDEAPGEDWSTERLRLGRRDTGAQTCFARTERGAVARVTVSIADPYSTASAVLQWVLAPPALPVFVPGPRPTCALGGGVMPSRWRGLAMQRDGWSSWRPVARPARSRRKRTASRSPVSIRRACTGSRCAACTRAAWSRCRR
jgi:hypothetical protein